MSYVEDCPFCATQDVAEIFRTDLWRAIYNRSPVVRGHSLLVPIRHSEHLASLTDRESAALIPCVIRLTTALLSVYAGTGFDVAIQEGEDAGQSIPHLHVHCIPRRRSDLADPGAWTQELGVGTALDDKARRSLSVQEMEAEANLIRSSLS